MSKKAEKPENIKLLNNIKYFRKRSGESQEDLALAVGLSNSTISMYENYQRVPDSTIINKIANHYKITVNELVSGTYYKPQCIIPQIEKMINDSDFIRIFAELIMPLKWSDKALENSYFKRAFRNHYALREKIAKSEFSNIDIDEIIKYYYKAIELSESKANLISLAITTEIFKHNSIVIEGFRKLKNKQINTKTYYTEYCLPSNDSIDFLHTESESNELIELDEEITDLLAELRKDNEYAFLVNYFIMLRYFFNCIDNNLPAATNAVIASEMMWSELSLYNPCVMKFYFEYVDKFL